MSYQNEFPDFPESDMPVFPAGFVDTSWRNDACPSFTSDEVGLTVFCDYADTAKREHDGVKRFSVQHQDHGIETSGGIETDDWAEVLAYIESHRKELMEG